MRRIAIALTALALLSAEKCKRKENAPGAGNEKSSMAGLLDRKWVFETLPAGPVQVPDGVEQPWIQLTADGLRGFGGCNRLMGEYKLEGNALSFPGVASTKMYCEKTQPLEEAIKAALSKTESYRLDGSTLSLMGGGERAAVLREEKP